MLITGSPRTTIKALLTVTGMTELELREVLAENAYTVDGEEVHTNNRELVY